MAGQRQPIGLVMANGKKHLTKAEIEARQSSEVQPCADGIVAPSFLTAKQRKEFDRLAGQLQKIKIMGETDCDTLARYVTAEDLYRAATKELRKLARERPKEKDFADDPGGYFKKLDLYYAMLDSATRRQDRYFKQASVVARDLGLTISSRCKLVVPVKEEQPKQNKFSAFGAGKAPQEVTAPRDYVQ